jgi:hypothetical protein
MATKYSQIQPNTVFKTTNGSFCKIDDLYFVDMTGEYESMWSPMFDATIILAGETAAVAAAAAVEPEFIVDEQSRIMKKNPKYIKPVTATAAVAEAEVTLSASDTAFGGMWGSGEFDCGPEEFDYMAAVSIHAVGAMKALGEVVGLNGSLIIMMPAIVDTLTVAYEEYVKTHADPEGDSFKAIVKKVVTTAKKSAQKKAAKKSAKKVAKKSAKKAPKKGKGR